MRALKPLPHTGQWLLSWEPLYTPAPGPLRRYGIARTELKRALDLVICFILLPLVLAILGLCALAIKLESPGPVFSPQQRTGQGGRRFTMLQLRTTATSADENEPTPSQRGQLDRVKTQTLGTQRVTRTGQFLRSTGLDELAQILNVLRGDMTLVGPRPTYFSSDIYHLWHTARLEVRPGMTGPWRVAIREMEDLDECVRLDVRYIRTQSLSLDFRILLQTVGLVVRSGRSVAKRAIDIVSAGFLLLLLGPLMFLIAVVVRWTSPGPALFRQCRVGKNGRLFEILKFRTMREDAEVALASNPTLYATYVENDYKLPLERDLRITPIGRWLRRTSLDELPQLINVIRGEMSLVGPRPIVPDELVHYGSRASVLCSVPPGLTGAWQVLGRSELRYPERCNVELHYVNTWSLWNDTIIAFRTIRAVLSRRGAD